MNIQGVDATEEKNPIRVEAGETANPLVNTLKTEILRELQRWIKSPTEVKTISEAQMKAFRKVCDALPPNIGEKLMKLAPLNDAVGKLDQMLIGAQDFGWKIAKTVLFNEVPGAGLIPGDICSNMQIIAIETGAKLWSGILKPREKIRLPIQHTERSIPVIMNRIVSAPSAV